MLHSNALDSILSEVETADRLIVHSSASLKLLYKL